MKLIKEKNLYKLFSLLSKRRKKEIYFFIILAILNGISESLSISTIIPFLTLIISRDKLQDFEIINSYIPFDISSSSQLLFFLTALFITFILFSTFFRIFNSWYILRLSAKIDIELSNILFKKNIYQSYAEYISKSSSKIISLITEKVAACSSALSSLFNILLSSTVSISIIIALLFFNWKIVSISFIFIYFYYLLISKRVKKILSNNGEFIAINDPLKIKTIQESFYGFRDIFINGTENIYLNLFNKYNSIIKIKNAKSQLYVLFPKFLLEGLILLIIAILGYLLSVSNYENSNFIPTIGAFVYSLQRLFPLIQQVYAAWANYKVKSARINDVLDEIRNNNYKPRLLMNKKRIIFNKSIFLKDISFSYRVSNSVLNNVNIEIFKGDHIGIYGETGSGKSTLLDIFMGLLSPNKGEIVVDDISLNKNNFQYNWTSQIAHVPQSIFLKEGTIAENISFGEQNEKINKNLLKKVSKLAKLDKFIEESNNGLQTIVGERGIKLSGGQRQRIAIARALYKQRAILVLDEATSALDEKTEKEILDSILKFSNKLTIIMVTHRLKSLQNFNRVLKITSKGNVEEK